MLVPAASSAASGVVSLAGVSASNQIGSRIDRTRSTCSRV
jgi:hypothetical protein